VTDPDVWNVAVAGVGYRFTPPATGLWTFRPTANYTYLWEAEPNRGSATCGAFFAISVYTYVNGSYVPGDSQYFTYTLWNAVQGPGTYAGNQNNGVIDPSTGYMQLDSSNVYIFWVWFDVSGLANGDDSGAGGIISAVVSSMNFLSIHRRE
jgi:hypothetical protein